MNKRELDIIAGFRDSQIIKATGHNILNTQNEILGEEEGEVCNRDGCTGIIEEKEKESCVCHLGMPPCGACTAGRFYCDECGWEEEDA